jgi:hypothetical protein
MPRTIEVTELILRDGHQSLSDIVVERFETTEAVALSSLVEVVQEA